MIIFYHKKTGKIIGTIDGRKHSKEHLNMWIGDKEETKRIVITGEIIKKNPYFEKVEILEDAGVRGDLGESIYRKVVKKVKRFKDVYWEVKHKQKKLFMEIDKNPSKIKEYMVDIKTKELKEL